MKQCVLMQKNNKINNIETIKYLEFFRMLKWKYGKRMTQKNA